MILLESRMRRVRNVCQKAIGQQNVLTLTSTSRLIDSSRELVARGLTVWYRQMTRVSRK